MSNESKLQLNNSIDNSKQFTQSQVPQLTEQQKEINMEQLRRFIVTSGVSDAFQVVFAEIIDKKLKEEDAYKYTAGRLREMSKGLQAEQFKAKQEMQKKEDKEKSKQK